MSNSTLIAHNPKFQSKAVSYDELKDLPVPEVLGKYHRPVPHVELVDALKAEAEIRNLVVTKEQYALGSKGAALFGVLDLRPAGDLALVPSGEMGLSVGFRSANDMSLGIKGVAGQRVFVCDNLALSGDMVAFARKHTKGIDLAELVRGGFDKVLVQSGQLVTQIAGLADAVVSDDDAKIFIYEVFTRGILPVRILDDVHRFYFSPTDETPDCLPRTRWGLHNAFTRAIKALRPTRAFAATVAIGRRFGLGNAPVDEPVDAVLDGEVDE